MAAQDDRKGPKKHKSIIILWRYPYLIGLPYNGVYMGYPYPYFLLIFWGPICKLRIEGSVLIGCIGLMGPIGGSGS